jgi:hypothetical protein
MRKPLTETGLGSKGVVVMDRVIIAGEAREQAKLLISNGAPLSA